MPGGDFFFASEVNNQAEFQAHFEDNPLDLEYLRHDKPLHPTPCPTTYEERTEIPDASHRSSVCSESRRCTGFGERWCWNVCALSRRRHREVADVVEEGEAAVQPGEVGGKQTL